MKKIYIQPGCEVVEIKTQCHLIQPSKVDVQGLGDGWEGYDDNGGDQKNSW